MIKGLDAGFNGTVYIYYRGPIQLVLSDVSAGYKPTPSPADTALRVVLRPNKWTEVPYACIKERWETGLSQLNFLAKDNYVDIYTDPKEVAQVKRQQAGESLPQQPAEVSETPVPETNTDSGFTLNKPVESKYFDLAKLGALSSEKPVQTAEPKRETLDNINVGEIDNTNKHLYEIMMKQAENANKQTEQLGKLMETTQQMMALLLKNMTKGN